MSDVRYVLKNRTSGKYIALDRSSGGYPYDVDSVFEAHMWKTPVDAIKYNAVMSWNDYENPVFSMEAISIVTESMRTPTGEDLEVVRYPERA